MAVEPEFWPEHGGGPLWDGGRSVDLGSLPLGPDLRERLRGWNAGFSDDRLPFGSPDVAWLDEGRTLLRQVRAALAATHAIVVHEPWWDEPET